MASGNSRAYLFSLLRGQDKPQNTTGGPANPRFNHQFAPQHDNSESARRYRSYLEPATATANEPQERAPIFKLETHEQVAAFTDQPTSRERVEDITPARLIEPAVPIPHDTARPISRVRALSPSVARRNQNGSDDDAEGGIFLADLNLNTHKHEETSSVDSLYADQNDQGPRRHASPHPVPRSATSTEPRIPPTAYVPDPSDWSPFVSKALWGKYQIDIDSMTRDEMERLRSQLTTSQYYTELNNYERRLIDLGYPQNLVYKLCLFRAQVVQDPGRALEQDLDEAVLNALVRYPRLNEYAENIRADAIDDFHIALIMQRKKLREQSYLTAEDDLTIQQE